MSQAVTVGPVDQSVGYVLKAASTALRTAMEAALRPMGLSVAQYSCLEVLGQRPEISSAELARATFVTRQSMNEVLRTLQQRALVTRPATATHGRALPSRLTDSGREHLHAASAAVRAIEEEMLSRLSAASRRVLLEDLAACAAALGGGAGGG